MPDTTVKLQDITPVKSTFDNDDQLLLINPTGEARISKADFATELGYTANSKAPVITETVTGAIANFPDGADNIPVADLVVNIEPKQSGSGDPSPDNIRPISGWTGCNVTRTGVNIWDEEWEVGSLGNDGEPIPGDNNTIRSKNYIPCMPETEYCIPMYSNQSGAYVYGVYQYDAEKNHISFVSINSYTKIFTTAPNAYYLKFRTFVAYGTTYNHDISINYPASDTEYHAYQGQTATLSWQTEAGTVYGGTIDVATGLLTVTNGYIASYNGETLPSTWISDRDVYSSGTTPTTGAQVVYALATPQTYQLTPQDVYTLLGTNNVWADTGNVSVTYPADTKMFIENLTQPTEDDMTADHAISSGTFFMLGNNLYLATAAIASGATIIEGTNATRLSLADALNRLS